MTLRDRKIVEMFAGGATPDEVEDALGVPAAKALHRCKEILGAKDIFDEVEERKLVVTQYQALYQKGHALLDATGVKDWPKGVEALTKLLTALLEARKQEEYRSDREIEAMTRAQASILIRVVQLSYDRARELLAREYPQVDLLEIDAAFQSGLRELSNESGDVGRCANGYCTYERPVPQRRVPQRPCEVGERYSRGTLVG